MVYNTWYSHCSPASCNCYGKPYDLKGNSGAFSVSTDRNEIFSMCSRRYCNIYMPRYLCCKSFTFSANEFLNCLVSHTVFLMVLRYRFREQAQRGKSETPPRAARKRRKLVQHTNICLTTKQEANASIQKALQSQYVQCLYNKCSTTSVSSVISSAAFGDFTTDDFTYNAAYPSRQAVKSKTMIFWHSNCHCQVQRGCHNSIHCRMWLPLSLFLTLAPYLR